MQCVGGELGCRGGEDEGSYVCFSTVMLSVLTCKRRDRYEVRSLREGASKQDGRLGCENKRQRLIRSTGLRMCWEEGETKHTVYSFSHLSQGCREFI